MSKIINGIETKTASATLLKGARQEVSDADLLGRREELEFITADAIRCLNADEAVKEVSITIGREGRVDIRVEGDDDRYSSCSTVWQGDITLRELLGLAHWSWKRHGKDGE